MAGRHRPGDRRAPRHDRDAGGDPALREAKAALRERIWDTLTAAGVARFPGARGRIPNFAGAEAAAARLAGLPVWERAAVVKVNPDAPQLPVRQRALEDGKLLYMAVPRLTEPEPFFELDPVTVPTTPRRAASIKGAARHGRRVPCDRMRPVDLVVVGSVAVGRDGARLGKGGGFADLELALLAEAGLLSPETPVVTTVHPLQVLDAGEVPRADHDVDVDLIVTPGEVIATGARRRRPRLHPGELTAEKIRAVPLLARILGASGAGPPGSGDR